MNVKRFLSINFSQRNLLCKLGASFFQNAYPMIRSRRTVCKKYFATRICPHRRLIIDIPVEVTIPRIEAERVLADPAAGVRVVEAGPVVLQVQLRFPFRRPRFFLAAADIDRQAHDGAQLRPRDELASVLLRSYSMERRPRGQLSSIEGGRREEKVMKPATITPISDAPPREGSPASREELLAAILDGSVIERVAEHEYWLGRPRVPTGRLLPAAHRPGLPRLPGADSGAALA